jgi:hypothetical protein
MAVAARRLENAGATLRSAGLRSAGSAAARSARAVPQRSEPSRRTAPGRRPATGRPHPARRQAPARRRSGTAVRRTRTQGLVGRTANAVTALPETGAVRRIARGRAWIAIIGVLLIGIVAINVVTVSYGAMSSRIGTDTAELQRQNSILSSQITTSLSMPRVRDAAASAGMAMPAGDQIIYRQYQPGDIAAAAERLAAEGG